MAGAVRRRRGLLGLALLALTTLGCGRFLGPLLAPGAATPEEAVRRTVNASPEIAATFRVWGRRQSPHGVVVLYTTRRPAEDQTAPMEMFQYSLVEWKWGGWWPVSGGGFGSSEPASPEVLVDYGTSRGNLTIIFGRVLAPEVSAVEATFDNDQTLRDDAADNVFALIAPAGTAPCELRVLGAEEQVLRRFDLGPAPAPGKESLMLPNSCDGAPVGPTQSPA
ncbi:MAG: hypothetical protein M5U01_24655 [Ardenticatenaceae bacterium]|nr:hypothetical protein [Ardenticatenaceae bacterium]